MSTISELVIKLGVDDSEVDKAVQNTPGRFDKLGGQMAARGATLSKTVTLPIIAAGAGLFALAGKQEDAEAKLQSSFDSMAAAGWTTVDELQAQASAFQQATTFGDEGILEMQSVLLTFGNVTGDVFTDATRLGLDMSAKLGTDLQSTAIQVGKALNDPVQGISALSRVGVSFTEDQKDMVKAMVEAGDTAGAQSIIMGELEKQFGGTAEAMAQTGTGQAKQAMNALGDAGESIGRVLIPVVSRFAGWMKTLAERFQTLSPEAQEWIVRIGAVAAAVGPVLIVAGKLVQSFGMVGKAFSVLSKLMMANPWVLLIAGVVALVVLIVQNWDKILAFLNRAWEWIKQAAGVVGQWISDAFHRAVEFIKNLFLNFTPLGLIIKNFDRIKELATGVWDWLKTKFQQAVDFIKDLFFRFTPLGIIISKFDRIKEIAAEAGQWIKDKFDSVVEFFRALPGRISSAVTGLWDGLKTAFRNAVNWVIDRWNSFRLQITLPRILGGGTIGIDTPNIPRLHDGGIYQAPPGAQEGLALLQAGEMVIPADMVGAARQASQATPIVIQGDVYGFDDFARKVRDAQVRNQRRGVA